MHHVRTVYLILHILVHYHYHFLNYCQRIRPNFAYAYNCALLTLSKCSCVVQYVYTYVTITLKMWRLRDTNSTSGKITTTAVQHTANTSAILAYTDTSVICTGLFLKKYVFIYYSIIIHASFLINETT